MSDEGAPAPARTHAHAQRARPAHLTALLRNAHAHARAEDMVLGASEYDYDAAAEAAEEDDDDNASHLPAFADDATREAHRALRARALPPTHAHARARPVKPSQRCNAWRGANDACMTL
jgi:hypothetical protein